MLEFNSMYFDINQLLVSNGYLQADFNTQKYIVEQSIIDYLKNCFIKRHIFVSENNLLVLLEEYVKLLPIYKRDSFICSLIHIILNIASNAQEWTIVWYGIEDTIGVENREDGLWDRIMTPESCDYLEVFKQVYNHYQNHFYVNTDRMKLEFKKKDGQD